MTRPVPTQLDIENAERRRALSDKFRSEYDDALALATSLFGTGWEPTGRHYLVEKDAEDEARRTGTRAQAAATVIAVRNAAGDKRHFRVETMTECASVEAGFGAMLLEPHPTKRFTWAEKEITPHRYSLCWGWYEPGYKPKSADQLAAARAKREGRAVEREAEATPLFAAMIREEGFVPRKGRPP